MIERLPTWSRSCLTMQGYGALSDSERRSLWLGLRFSPLLCFAGIALGTLLASPELLLVMAATAFVGGFLTPKHPFDYVYDAALRPLLGGPSVPPSPPPRRFACQLATPWIAAIALAFAVGATTLAWVLAVPLLVVAATVMTTNWCLPSLIYGLLHGGRGGEPRPL
jgi:ABC-type phosphate/phosphonate transport system permease subunit